MHSGVYAFRDRRARKGDFRRLWVQRVNAACRVNGSTYSRFIAGLKAAGVEVDRKVLADLAVRDEAAFARLVELAREALPSSPGAGVAAGAWGNGRDDGRKGSCRRGLGARSLLSSLNYRHQRVQRLRRLVGRRSARADEGRFVIEGANLLEEALKANAPIEAVYLDAGWSSERPDGPAPPDDVGPGAGPAPAAAPGPARQARLAGLVAQCFEQGARVFELEAGVLARVADTVTPQPVIAVVDIPCSRMADVRASGPRLVVVCVDVRDPGNAGTVVRSAWAAGRRRPGVLRRHRRPLEPQGRPVLGRRRPARARRGGRPRGRRAVRARRVGAGQVGQRSGEGGTDYAITDLTRPTALVLGNEAAGLRSAELRPHLDGVVSIPMAAGPNR